MGLIFGMNTHVNIASTYSNETEIWGTDREETTCLKMALHSLTGTPRDLGLLSLSSLDNFT